LEIWQQQFYFDIMVKKALDSIASPALDLVMIHITNLGSPMAFYILAAAGFLFLAYRKKLIQGFFLVFSLFVSWGSMNLLKSFFMRDRPVGEHLTFAAGYSFPSGHATLAMVFYGFIIYLLLTANKKGWTRIIAWLLAFLIFMIGLSRVYLNVHYATDVLAGFILGSILLAFFVWAFKSVEMRS